MPLAHEGLTKLVEEAGEVIQVAAKLQAYPGGVHPDGGSLLRERLADELGDLLAAAEIVIDLHALDRKRIAAQWERKLLLFRLWHATEA